MSTSRLIGTYQRRHHRFKEVSDEEASSILIEGDTPDTLMELRRTINELERENFDLVAKCLSLIGKLGWSSGPDGRIFTFPDGETWNEFTSNIKDDDDE